MYCVLRFDNIPRWRNLNHFDMIMHIHFTDGSKYKDIIKVHISQPCRKFWCTHFTHHSCWFMPFSICSPRTLSLLVTWYCDASIVTWLLICMHHLRFTLNKPLLQVMWSIISLQGSSRYELCICPKSQLTWKLQQYIEEATGDEDFCDMNWEFIKLRLSLHLFDDIESKGVTQNDNTKLNKKLHGPLKNAYKDQTNFKYIAPQVSLIDIATPFMTIWLITAQISDISHQFSVARIIHNEIATLDEFNGLKNNSELPPDIKNATQKIALGSKWKPISFRTLEEGHWQDPAFEQFHIWLVEFMWVHLDKVVHIDPNDQVTVWICDINWNYTHQILDDRVLISQSQLWVNCWLAAGHWLLTMQSSFHNQECQDFVILNVDNKSILFVQLVYVFKYQATDDEVRLITLVHPFYAKIPWWEIPQKDLDLQLIQVCTTWCQEAQFIFVNLIIRGALAVRDDGEGRAMGWLVGDVVNRDMFLHLHYSSFIVHIQSLLWEDSCFI